MDLGSYHRHTYSQYASNFSTSSLKTPKHTENVGWCMHYTQVTLNLIYVYCTNSNISRIHLGYMYRRGIPEEPTESLIKYLLNIFQ